MTEATLLVDLFAKAKRAADLAAAADGGCAAEEKRCVGALNLLTEINVTTSLLQSAPIAKKLRLMTQHPCKSIQDKSSDLLKKWQKMIFEDVISNKIKNGTSDCSKKRGLKLKKSAASRLKSIERTNDKNRDNIREIVAKALCRVGNELCSRVANEVKNKKNYQYMLASAHFCDPFEVAGAVETALFETLGSCDGPKKLKYRLLMSSLQDDKNPDFRRRVLLGVIPVDLIPKLSSQDMATDAKRLQNEEIANLSALHKPVACR